MTQTCNQVRDQWLLSADEGLSARQRSRLQRHIDGCEACRQWQADSDRWSSLAGSMTPDISLQTGTRAVIRAAARRLHPLAGWRGSRIPFSLPALAAALLVFAGLAVWRVAQDRSLPPSPVVDVSPPLSTAEKMDVLAGLLEPVDAGGEGTIPAPRLADDPLVDWILRTQALETMDYLDHRLIAAAG